jgi:hypothetical protein
MELKELLKQVEGFLKKKIEKKEPIRGQGSNTKTTNRKSE